jgi:D-aminopeptidase
MTTSSTDTALSQLGELLLNNVVVAAMPVISSALADIAANPAVWTNPASGFLKGTAVLAELQATLPQIENTSTTTLANVVQAVIAAGVAKLTPAPLPTPTQIALEMVDAAPAPAAESAPAVPLVGQAPL